MIERLLIPLDGSELAESMLARMSLLLGHDDSRVTLLSVAHAPATEDFIRHAMAKEQTRDVQRYLVRTAEKLRATAGDVETRVELGRPAETILDVADDIDASLICLSTHGRSGVDHLLYGSVTEKTVRVSERPVLVVPSFDRTEPEGGVDRREWAFRSIVVALDGSPAAMKIVSHVAHIAQLFDSAVTLLVVLEEGADEKLEGLARKHLEGASKLFEKAGVGVEAQIRNGNPATEIVDYASRYDHDMIMMTTHGRSGVSRWMLGSVAEKVVRSATVPVLVVRSTGAPETSP